MGHRSFRVRGNTVGTYSKAVAHGNPREAYGAVGLVESASRPPTPSESIAQSEIREGQDLSPMERFHARYGPGDCWKALAFREES